MFDMAWEEEDSQTVEQFEKIAHQNNRADPCDDDCEMTCPWIDFMPEESDHEGSSPLNFK